MALRALQINVNHSWTAQDLCRQRALELKVGFVLVSEPRHIPDSPLWFSSLDQKSAVYWQPEHAPAPCRLMHKGEGFVAIGCRDYIIVSCYISPSSGLSSFEEFLEELEDCLRQCKSINSKAKILLGGDFNAKSPLWGSNRKNRRGDILEEWAATMDLRVLNAGGAATCVRPQGSSIVDLTWISPNLARADVKWQVLDEESMSDHLFILTEVREVGVPFYKDIQDNPSRSSYRRWNLKRIDLPLFEEALSWGCLLGPASWASASSSATWVTRLLRQACDLTAPRARSNAKKSVYWWNTEIANKRKESNLKRRRYTRSCKKKDMSDSDRSKILSEYKECKRELKNMINRAKTSSWKELLDGIEEDPWGLPYKIVMGKLRRSTPSFTETLSEEDLERLMLSLFPRCAPSPPALEWREEIGDWDNGFDVTGSEIAHALHARRKKGGNVAPGPDGIKYSVLKAVPGEMDEAVSNCFTMLLREGLFPSIWKKARLALIPKAGSAQPDKSAPPKARPICLLDEIGKAFERIIALRLLDWLKSHPEHDLSACQFGFRQGLSTSDAILFVKSRVGEAVKRGSVIIIISLDIANAFNSIPWRVILNALKEKSIPPYLIRIINSYLSERYVEYPAPDGFLRTLSVEAGVPQGSILGPLLWNIAYDSVLQTGNRGGCSKVCYADDTLIIVEAGNVFAAKAIANLQLAYVVNQLHRLGLQVAAEKTEAVLFSNKRRSNAPVDLTINGIRVVTKSEMKYLGVIIDNKWTFRPHFDYVKNKVARVTRALCRLMPNLKGPTENKRLLFYNTVASVILYAAPVWSEAVITSKHIRSKVCGMQRILATRVISAYRTVSVEASAILARRPPFYLVAEARKRAFSRIRDLRDSGVGTRAGELEIRREEEFLLTRQWEVHNNNISMQSGIRVRMAIGPIFRDWLERRHGALEFHLTQMITGHGCFNAFLHKIGKCSTPNCARCGADLDTADHTLAECPAWTIHRDKLRAVVGSDLSLVAVVRSMTASREGWRAVRDFSRTVLSIKEEEERARQRGRPPPLRQGTSSSSG